MCDVHTNKVPSVILSLFQKKQLVATPTIQEHRPQEISILC